MRSSPLRVGTSQLALRRQQCLFLVEQPRASVELLSLAWLRPVGRQRQQQQQQQRQQQHQHPRPRV